MGRLTYMSRPRHPIALLGLVLTAGFSFGGCAIESPISVTDRPLAEQLEDRLADAGEAAGDNVDSAGGAAPESLAFAEALATGDFLRLHVTAEGVPAGLRSGPGSSYDLLSDVPPGAEVYATGSRTGEWVHVMYADFDGWLSARRVTFDATGEAEQFVDAGAVQGTPVTYVVVGEAIGVNLRSEPDATSELVSGAPTGSFVTGSGNTEGTWIEVTYEGVTGWASGNYLDPVDGDRPVETTATTTTTVAVTLNTDE